MQPFWFRPDHQPNPGDPVEFEIRPLDLRTLYEAQATMYESTALSIESVRSIFLRHVSGWRGIAEPHSVNAKQRVLDATGPIYGHELRDWLIWTAHVARHAYTQSLLTEDERKNS